MSEWIVKDKVITDLIKHEYDCRPYTRGYITMAAAIPNKLLLGTLLTATGTWDGALATIPNIVGILVYNTPATTETGTELAMLKRGPALIVYEELEFPTTEDEVKEALIAHLATLDILVIDVVVKEHHPYIYD